MPDIMRDWHIWWLDFWTAHPFVFWAAVICGVVLGIISRRVR